MTVTECVHVQVCVCDLQLGSVHVCVCVAHGLGSDDAVNEGKNEVNEANCNHLPQRVPETRPGRKGGREGGKEVRQLEMSQRGH